MQDDQAGTPAGGDTAPVSGAVPFPSPPWRLRGTLYASLWRVPHDLAAALGGTGPPALRLGRSALLVTGWARYAPGGALVYDEMLCAVPLSPVRRRAVRIGRIWVDSAASAAGGQALWAIPKRLGRFAGDPAAAGGATVADTGIDTGTHSGAGPVASFRFTPSAAWRGGLLPGRWRFALRTEQPRGGEVVTAAIGVSGRLRPGRGTWTFAADGPLAPLSGMTPWLTVALEDADMRFGG
ncbi:MAG: acetoacetate decarboxylase family protein [Alphaproteobacteria bacterium]